MKIINRNKKELTGLCNKKSPTVSLPDFRSKYLVAYFLMNFAV